MTLLFGVAERTRSLQDPTGITSRRRSRNRPAATKSESPGIVRTGGYSRILAILLCIPLLPVIGILYVLVRLTSRGPGFYSQVRLGQGGRRFEIYKLRSMKIDAESVTGPVWATKNDPRTTWLGKYLRRYHLDELPQIFNVVKGEMNFVGPRPERPEIAAELVERIPGYLDRLAVRPGITGMAQIHLPPDSSLDSVRKKLSYDLAYINRASLLLDLRIILATAVKAIPFSGPVTQQVGYCASFFRYATELFENRTVLSVPEN